MALSNSNTRYGAVSKSFHWLTALLILTLIPLGLIAHDMAFDTSEALARKAWLFSLHKTLGVTVFFVALARIAWAFSQPKPGLLNAEHRLESFAAETVHWLLYGSIVLVPLAGWIHHAATSGFAPIWWPFGQDLPLIPKNDAFAAVFGGLHNVLAKLLALAIILHAAGALKHHVIDRDATLRRMLPGEPVLGPMPQQSHSRKPIAAALFTWAAAVLIGAGLGMFSQKQGSVAPEDLASVTSDWGVQSGSIELTVSQFGSDVTGRFEDWTAAISFDPETLTGVAGKVEATISVGSLKLGSVTDQALGADFFDVQSFPTAVFAGDIHVASDGYDAIGTLTIKDNTVPLTLPFIMSIRDGEAQMRGTLSLDRRSFGIGDNMNDEASLGFDVVVNVRLKATRP